MLVSVGGKSGDLLPSNEANMTFGVKVPRLRSFHDLPLGNLALEQDKLQESAPRLSPHGHTSPVMSASPGYAASPVSDLECSLQRCESVSLRDMEDGKTLVSLHQRIQQCINYSLELSGVTPNVYRSTSNLCICRAFDFYCPSPINIIESPSCSYIVLFHSYYYYNEP